MFRMTLVRLSIVTALLALSLLGSCVSPQAVAKIMFISDRGGSDEIYVMNADGTGLQCLTDNQDMDISSYDHRTGPPKWSPDGSKIAFASEEDIYWMNSYDIWVMNTDGSGIKAISEMETAGEYSHYLDRTPAWSPDGARIAFSSYRDISDPGYAIWETNADGSNLTKLTDYSSWSSTEHIVWSPNGSKIAFVAEGIMGESSRILIMNSDGSDIVECFWDSTASNKSPVWSPDSTKIAFVSDLNKGSGKDDIYVMNADGTGEINLTDSDDRDYMPSWSPDGSKILFTSNRDDNDEIYVMDADGTDPVNLSNNNGKDYMPSWSSDGSRIAFVSDRDDNAEIYVMNADGTGQVRLTDNDAEDLWPSWSH